MTHALYKGAATSLFHFFMNMTAVAVLNPYHSADGIEKNHSRLASGKRRKFTIFFEVANLFLKKYGINAVTAKTKSNMKRFEQPSHMTQFQYAEELVADTLL